jgi:hypothetical protein
MSYEIVLAEPGTAETGTLTLQFDQQIEIRVGGQEAHRRVSNWAHLVLSSQIQAHPPQLVVTADGEAYWRVPLHLTFPALGDVGLVGHILVDVQDGQVEPDAALVTKIKQNAQALAQRFTSVPA